LVKDNPAKWISKYGSLVTTIYGVGTANGFNERGLGTHLTATEFGQRDPSKPGVNAARWAQYVLDNAATVDEALTLLKPIQVTPAEARGHQASVHLAIEDSSGDSAIIEYISGKPVIHHGREFKIMTNDPVYDEQLALLKKQDFSKPSSDTPSTVSSGSPMSRQCCLNPQNEREAVAGVTQCLCPIRRAL
jgi:penicillin V acylase-like amidase (Ntn superfamily)